MTHIRRTTATVAALVLALIGLSAPAAFAAVEPQDPASSGTAAVFIPVAETGSSGSFEGWQVLLTGVSAALVAVVLTAVVMRLAAIHHSRSALAGT